MFLCNFIQESPDAVTFTAGLTSEEVAIAKEAVNNIVVGDWAEWNIGAYAFQVTTVLDTVGFSIVVESDCVNCDSIYWYVGDGTVYNASSFTHTYGQPGLYGITMVAYQCGEYDSQYWEAYIETPTEIETHNTQVSFKRVSHDTISIHNNGSQSLEFDLYQLNGQQIKHYTIDEKIAMITLPKMPSGIYLLKAKNFENSFFKFHY